MTTTQKLAIGVGVIGGVLALYFLAKRKPPVGSAFGKVVDEMGEPLGGVIVRFVWSVDSEEWMSEVETDPWGMFIKDDLPAVWHIVSFIKTGYYAPDKYVKIDPNYAAGLGITVMELI